MGFNPNFTSYTKINSKWITDLNVKCKTLKLLGKKIHSRKCQDPGLDKKFLELIPKAQSRKGNIDKLESIKIKNFCSTEDLVRGWKQATEWEKTFANHMSDKGLVFRIYKELSKLNS